MASRTKLEFNDSHPDTIEILSRKLKAETYLTWAGDKFIFHRIGIKKNEQIEGQVGIGCIICKGTLVGTKGRLALPVSRIQAPQNL